MTFYLHVSPTKSSLPKYLTIAYTPAYSSNVLDIPEDAAKNWREEDRACVIAFDEMAVRSNLKYDTKHDVVFGFQIMALIGQQRWQV